MRAAGEATRERIPAAAKEEFARYGFAGARISRISAEAKASKERLYAYFPSKESLFAAVRRGQRTGHIDPAWDPVELFRITKSLALPNPVLRKLRQVNGQPDMAAERQAAIEAVQRLIKPPGRTASEARPHF
jgi:AcrR family transcriptional regulator